MVVNLSSISGGMTVSSTEQRIISGLSGFIAGGWVLDVKSKVDRVTDKW